MNSNYSNRDIVAKSLSIRQIAICMSRMEASVVEQLLSEFPSDSHGQIRASMDALQGVSLQEQQAAEQAMLRAFEQQLDSRDMDNEVEDPSTCDAKPTGSDDSPEEVLEQSLEQSRPNNRPQPNSVLHSTSSSDRAESIADSNSNSNFEEAPGPQQLAVTEQLPVIDTDVDHLPRNESMRALASALRAADPNTLFTILRDERLTTLAIVVAALTPQQAAAFLTQLNSEKQVDVVQCVAVLDQADKQIVAELCDEILGQLTLAPEASNDVQLGHVHSILAAVPESQRRFLVDALARKDKSLAEQLTRSTAATTGTAVAKSTKPHVEIAFDRFVDLDDESLVCVFERLPKHIALQSLAGASQPCLRDILSRLPEPLSSELSRGLQHIGALKLNAIHQAQAAAVKLSREVLAEVRGPNSEHLKLSA